MCTLLYTFCKVRGYKVIVGFFNNEPKHLEPVLEALEECTNRREEDRPPWYVSYTLLLWLTHLLLTPFDLASISTKPASSHGDDAWTTSFQQLPALAGRMLRLGLTYLPERTKAQEAAAAMLVRLVTRPDVLKYDLGNSLVRKQLEKLDRPPEDTLSNPYERLGALRLLARAASSIELLHLIPEIYEKCEQITNAADNTAVTTDAVAKKLLVKTFRNIAILSLRSAPSDETVLDFIQNKGVLENVIDYLLRSLGDNDTPVRYAGAKAISSIILELESDMGYEVIQAILDSFKEDMPALAPAVDFTTVNPLKWHGFTLALAHIIFKRSASPSQLPDILKALVSALQFQQRTATGTMLGTNVRDAANFGIWSLSRRYTTSELLSVTTNLVRSLFAGSAIDSVIQILAIELILSACLDPVGNIRRGASAALQELVGRHPNIVHEGITLVQTVDYQAVGLRQRAMVDVAHNTAELHQEYWRALIDGLFGWRGLGSADVAARENAAMSIARLTLLPVAQNGLNVLRTGMKALEKCSVEESEALHGLAHILASIVEAEECASSDLPRKRMATLATELPGLWACLRILQSALKDFSPRVLRSELPTSVGRFLTAVSSLHNAALGSTASAQSTSSIPWDTVDAITEKLLTRNEESMMRIVPALVNVQLTLKRTAGAALNCISVQKLASKVASDGTKNTRHGAGKAIALGALANQLVGESSNANIISTTLTNLMDASNVEWRVIGGHALQLLIESISSQQDLDSIGFYLVVDAIHRGLNDYTIDERGDVGSLVRLQAISCADKVLSNDAFCALVHSIQVLQADIYRLSLEKLDKVRLQAAQSRHQHLGFDLPITDLPGVSSLRYFETALQPLRDIYTPNWITRALLEGCVSCAGFSAEPLQQASRKALVLHLVALNMPQIEDLTTTLTTIMSSMLAKPTPNLHPPMELLAFLLDMQIIQRLVNSSSFKWRNLLSVVQKAHHKSNDIPKILAAVHVYVRLAEIPSIRFEVRKKLLSMLQTNPYPRVRAAVAEAWWEITGEESLKGLDCTKRTDGNQAIAATLRRSYLVE